MASAGTAAYNVVLLGHSYIRRLSQYMDADVARHNLGFNPQEVTVRCVCAGGAFVEPGRVPADKSILKLLNDALALKPDIIFIHIGENDVQSISQETISQCLMAQIMFLSQSTKIKMVICSELFPMPKFGVDRVDRVKNVNRGLGLGIDAWNAGRLAGEKKVMFWKHEMGLYRPDCDLFDVRDRTHLNEHGTGLYYRSVKAAIGRSFSLLQGNQQ